MTISTTTSRISYSGNGVTTAFAVPFPFLANADLVVILVSAAGVETAQTITTHYTVAGAGGASGTVTMITAPATGEKLVIYRDPAITQETDYIEGDAFPAETHEQGLDRLTMISQRLADLQGRSVRLSDGDTSGADVTLPTPEAGKVLAWDSDGTALVHQDGIGAVVGVAYLSESHIATAGQTVFTLTGITYTPGVRTLHVYIQGVRQAITAYAETSSTVVTFSEGLDAGDVVEFITAEPVTNSVNNSANVTFTGGGIGTVDRNVQERLREVVSVTDFGTSSAAIDNEVAFNAAIAYLISQGGGVLTIPPGVYPISDQILCEQGVGVHIIGSGIDATVIQKAPGFPAKAGVRFLGGENNSVRDFTFDNNNETGRGVYIQDKYTICERVYCTNSVDRPFGLNGGENNYYGVAMSDSIAATITGITQANPAVVTAVGHGLTSTDKVVIQNVVGMTEVNDIRFNITVLTADTFSLQDIDDLDVDSTGYTAYTSGGTATETNFEPVACELHDCRVYNSAKTAFSQKRMRWSHIDSCQAQYVGSEGATIDVGSNHSVVSNCTLRDVARTDIGGGGVGGIGIDNILGAKCENNAIYGVQLDVAEASRTKPAINVVNNVGSTFGTRISGNSFYDFNEGIRLTTNGLFVSSKNIISENMFDMESSGTRNCVVIDANSNNNLIQGNRAYNGSFTISDSGTGNTNSNNA